MSFDETEESVDFVHDVFQYLKDGKYPNSYTLYHKRIIRRKAKRFALKDGVLFYKQKRKNQVLMYNILRAP